MLCVSTSVLAQEEEKPYDYSKLIDAIAMTESRGNPRAYNPNGDCVGLLQITKILVRECNNILRGQGKAKEEFYTYDDRWDEEKSKEMFILLQRRFNKENNVEKAIKTWNVGFYSKTWRTSPKANAYYKKVMKYYKG